MSTLDEWLADAAKALGLPPDTVPADLRNQLLDLTRDVAHGVARIAGPLTTYQVGLAVGRGASPSAAIAALADVVRAHEGERADRDSDPAGPPAPGADTSVPAAQEQQPLSPAGGENSEAQP